MSRGRVTDALVSFTSVGNIHVERFCHILGVCCAGGGGRIADCRNFVDFDKIVDFNA